MPDRIDEIKARLEAATAGPWSYRRTSDPDLYWVRGDRREVGVIGGNSEMSEASGPELMVPHDSEPDAELIANAPADIEFLLGEVERLAELVEGRESHLAITSQENVALRSALERIASCEPHVSGDVVDVARAALADQTAAERAGEAAERQAEGERILQAALERAEDALDREVADRAAYLASRAPAGGVRVTVEGAARGTGSGSSYIVRRDGVSREFDGLVRALDVFLREVLPGVIAAALEDAEEAIEEPGSTVGAAT